MNQNVYRRKCNVCGEIEESNFQLHNRTEKHRFNHLLYEYGSKRKMNVNPKGFEIIVKLLNNVEDTETTTNKHQKLIVKIPSQEFQRNLNELFFKVEVINRNGEHARCEINILHPHSMFTLLSDNSFSITKGDSCNSVIKFKHLNALGSYKVPIGISMIPYNREVSRFSIFRDITIVISGITTKNEIQKETPFRVEKFICGLTKPPTKITSLFVVGYEIPGKYKTMILNGLQEWSDITDSESLELRRVKDLIDGGLQENTYIDFFQYLLWLEESSMKLGLEQFNMSDVTLKKIPNRTIELEIPGLAEKRPSVLPGDHILVRMDQIFGYTGIVDLVLDKSVHIKDFDQGVFKILETLPNVKWNVKFELSRLQLVRMHAGVRQAGLIMLPTLFPHRPLTNKLNTINIERSELFNGEINEEQFQAVINIVNHTSQHAPYIVFGPPGTGKTITIVEAILQITKIHGEKRILVCAPSNTACDMLAIKLSRFCEEKLLRLHTTTRDPETIPEEIKRFSNLRGGGFYSLTSDALNSNKIVISTLHLIGKYNMGYFPDMLFVDEAAQATEPECNIALSLMKPNSLVVLAGDPKQLGPVLSSYLAAQKGLGKSLMERLMETNDLYTRHRGGYDDNFITMLIQNYRSHEQILKIPNELFYEGELLCRAGQDRLSYVSISQLVWNRRKYVNDYKPRAVEFHGLLSKEERNGNSPSYFNDLELETVFNYVNVLMDLKMYNIKQRDIGIIAPYIRQVHKIRQGLDTLDFKDIAVGTTEAFQGTEKRIMIISTVRAQHSLLKCDRKYSLGFVVDGRRFNVALTRAQSKLIIIGNPYCLAYNNNWMAFMEHCKALGSYSGVNYMERSTELMHSITQILRIQEQPNENEGEKRKKKKKKRR